MRAPAPKPPAPTDSSGKSKVATTATLPGSARVHNIRPIELERWVLRAQ